MVALEEIFGEQKTSKVRTIHPLRTMNVQNVTTTADQRAVCRAMRLTTHTRSKTTAPIRLLTAAVTAFICVEDICQNIKLHTELQNTNRNSKGHFAPWAPHLHRQKKLSVRSNIVSFHGLFFHKQKKNKEQMDPASPALVKNHGPTQVHAGPTPTLLPTVHNLQWPKPNSKTKQRNKIITRQTKTRKTLNSTNNQQRKN